MSHEFIMNSGVPRFQTVSCCDRDAEDVDGGPSKRANSAAAGQAAAVCLLVPLAPVALPPAWSVTVTGGLWQTRQPQGWQQRHSYLKEDGPAESEHSCCNNLWSDSLI